MRREGVDEQNLLAGLRMRAHHRMLGVGELRLQREALLDRHRGAEARLDAVARAQAGDLRLDRARAAARRPAPCWPTSCRRRPAGIRRSAARSRTAASRARWRRCARRSRSGRSARRATCRCAPDPGCSGIAAGDRMVLELAEVAREGDVLGARDVLVAEEQHLVLAAAARGSRPRAPGRARRRRGSTFDSSAPIAQVSGSTLIDVD